LVSFNVSTTAPVQASLNTANATADETLMGNDVTTVDLPKQAPPTFSSGEPPPLQFKDIEAAANQFDRILARTGMLGAKAYSSSCHESASKGGDWSKHDFCAAFDLAGRYVDQGVTKNSSYPPNAYFLFEANNAADNYNGMTSSSYAVQQRLQSIKEAVEPAVTDAIEARIARTKPAPRQAINRIFRRIPEIPRP
jgi:hypothetical protein